MKACCNPLTQRDEDELAHAKFWWWFFWPVTLTITGIVFLSWIAAVLMIYAMILTMVVPAMAVIGVRKVWRLLKPEPADENAGA